MRGRIRQDHVWSSSLMRIAMQGIVSQLINARRSND